jgi:hypothetical protein
MAHLIAPHLNEKTIWGYLFKAYIIAPFVRKYRTISMRLMRKAKKKELKLTEIKLEAEVN